MKSIGIDIGGTNFRIGIVNEKREISGFEKIAVKEVFHSKDPLNDLYQKIEDFSRGEKIDAVAIGFPATLNAKRDRVVQAPNIPFMEDLPVKEYLEEKLNVPVFAERDVTFALLYDMKKYDVKEQGMSCGIYFGTGIGNAIAIDGKPYGGKHGVAGEIGHIPVYGSKEVCGCGNTGCLEAVAGGKALAKMKDTFYPETEISELFVKHKDDERVKDFIDLMSFAVTTEVNILDPDHVLLGGGVLNMKGFPKEYFRKCINARLRKPLPMEDLDLIFTDDESDKCVIGAAVYAHNQSIR